MRSSFLCAMTLCLVAACGGDDNSGAAAGAGGTAGDGSSGTSGTAGSAGSIGLGGSAGAATADGSAGSNTNLGSKPFSAKRIASGAMFNCVLVKEGWLQCWGNGGGPEAVGILTQVSARAGVACAIGTDGIAHCDGNAAAAPLKMNVPTTPFAEVRAGDDAACGRASDGHLSCWGKMGSAILTNVPTEAFSQISVGGLEACGVTMAGSTKCWGAPSTPADLTPPPSDFAVVEANISECGISADGKITCWGSNAFSGAPQDAGYVQVALGFGHGCALRQDGTAVCFGFSTDTAPPPAGVKFVELSAGGTHSCGIVTDGTVECWGTSTSGENGPPPAGTRVF
jgi:Regulator of chromosome condensation (RCC1) repeat